MMDDFDNRPQVYGEVGIHSTAGAVPIRNEKGEISMQKVKVQRYISGKRPDYAKRYSESESEEEDEDFIARKREGNQRDYSRSPTPERRRYTETEDVNDPRLRRLLAARLRDDQEDEDDRVERLKARRRRIQEPEIVEDAAGGERDDMEGEEDGDRKMAPPTDRMEVESEEESEDDDDDDDSDTSGDEEMDEEAIARRRELMRQRALARAQMGEVQEEVMQKEDEKSGPESGDESGEETSEDETDSDDEDGAGGARLKPVFVRAKDRLTVQEREREEAKARQAEKEAARAAEDRRRQTLRMVEDEVRRSTMSERAANKDDFLGMEEINTDDENDEVEYEAWKVRELKRLKRDREEREAYQKEQAELDRFRTMTEEEKRAELRQNPKMVTNKSVKGKYKFMQKYYHRGAFYLDEDQTVFKRDFSAPTLEDQFDKSVLPKVMQVKNFGRSGRTKYTHLVDQDSTQYDAPWAQETASNIKFQYQHAAGMKQSFERPSQRKK